MARFIQNWIFSHSLESVRSGKILSATAMFVKFPVVGDKQSMWMTIFEMLVTQIGQPIGHQHHITCRVITLSQSRTDPKDFIPKVTLLECKLAINILRNFSQIESRYLVDLMDNPSQFVYNKIKVSTKVSLKRNRNLFKNFFSASFKNKTFLI